MHLIPILYDNCRDRGLASKDSGWTEAHFQGLQVTHAVKERQDRGVRTDRSRDCHWLSDMRICLKHLDKFFLK
jgi:hypothetical protein